MYKLSKIRARVHSTPVTIPLLDEPIEDRRFVSCEVETDGGLVGFGLTGHFLPHAIVTAIQQHFEPLLLGTDIREVERIHSLVWGRLNPRAQTGVVAHALSAIDIALWDAIGKGRESTISRLLGGYSNRASTYVTFGFPEYDREELVEAAKLQTAAGVNCLKMVVGVDAGGWQEDARRVRAVRSAVGPDVQLGIDANYAFNPVDAALLCNAVEDCDLSWFEEPIIQNDVRQLAELRRNTRIPISAGQMVSDRWQLRELVDNQAIDILQPNVCYCGGFTDSRKVAHLAQCFNMPIMNGGGWPHFNMHFIAAMMNGWRVEFHLGMQQVGDLIFRDAPKPQNNEIVVPDAPGLGMQVDERFLADSVVMT